MKYPSGEEVRLGDQVQCWIGCHGVVVAAIDLDQYSPDYPRSWAYLGRGALIMTDQAGLIHYDEADEDLELIRRA